MSYQTKDACGIVYFYNADGRLHRDEDKPSVVGEWCRRWYRHGEFWREGGRPQEVLRLADGSWCEMWWSASNSFCRPVARQWHGPLEARGSMPTWLG